MAPPQRETTTVPGEERGDQASPDLLRVPRVKSGTNRPAVYFKGIVDAPAGRDLLGRTSMVETLSELLLEGELSVGAAPHSGPQVITIDGPWGSGKTTVMHLVKQRLDSEAGAWERRERRSLPIGGRVAELWHARRVTPAGILLTMWLGRRHTSVRDRAAGHSHSARTRAAPARKPPVTTILEPWAHQTSEQFWAALAKAVNQAAVPATFHYRNAQRRFWFRRNAERLDATSLRRALWRSLMSPLLRVAVIALAIPVAVQFLREDDAWTGYGQSADVWAIAVPAVLIGLGVLHTAARFLFGKASRFLPEEIFVSPVLSGALSASSPDPNLRDPLHHSQSGSLYLVQHDVRTVLDTLCTTGRELVIFVDDLDRCGPQVAMEALQALNLFLSGTLRGCRVVIGLDQEIVASQIEEFYRHVESARSSTPTDDPSPGWSFLRKLSHLPVVLPAVGESTLDMFLTEMLGEVEADVEKPILREVTTVLSPGVTRRHAELTARLDPVPAVPSQQMRSAPAERRAASARAVRQMPKALPIPDLHLYTLERHPEVRALMRQRIGAREELSGREIKRLINTWTFYGRILLRKMPTMTLEGAIRSSKALVILAEMLTRWPALARPLTAISNGELGIVTLSRNCGDYVSWHRALATSRLDRACHTKALKSLREVLLECDRDELEAVAIRLFHPRPG
ncbi:P-loop NTPase fold protein [Actinoplanes sp. NPDC051346]|uniref:P-loop NTPase fold protein n=1 Tax=Actinoplanes sp. NPDC051346 TaxID=3155048 RepID=UPI003449E088